MKFKNLTLKRLSSLFVFLFSIVLLSGCTQKQTEKNNYKNIILITIDALRPDHLGAYGYTRSTSPNIDNLAKNGVLFTNCYSHASWTAPSMVSMFTSTLPPTHGIIHAQVENNKVIYQEILNNDFLTLPELLKEAGYTTAGFSTNSHLVKSLGFAQGFDYYDESCLWEKGECINNKAIEWIKDNNDKKFFMWIHYIDAHADFSIGAKKGGRYNPPEEYRDIFKVEGSPMGKEVSEALYDAEIKYCDDLLGTLFKELEKYGIPENSVIIITADHGEAFNEHGNWYHTNTVYNEEIRIPLIISYPNLPVKGEKIDSTVREIDILPTILNIVGLKSPAQVQGTSLIPLVENKGEWEDKYVYSETRRWETLDLRSLISGDYKYIYDFKNSKAELYNTKDDPQEQNNIITEKMEIAEALKKKMDDEIAGKEKLAKKVSMMKELNKERIEKLKSLGYIK